MCFSGGGMFVKVSGWVVVLELWCWVVLMFWELVGDRMMFVRDEFFLSYGHIFGGVKCRICAGCDNFQKAHNLYYV